MYWSSGGGLIVVTSAGAIIVTASDSITVTELPRRGEERDGERERGRGERSESARMGVRVLTRRSGGGW